MIRRPPSSPLFPSATLSRSPRHYPGDESRREEEHQARGGDGPLNRMNLGIHARQRGRHACHREAGWRGRSEEHTSELQSQSNLVCRLLLEKKKEESRTS